MGKLANAFLGALVFVGGCSGSAAKVVSKQSAAEVEGRLVEAARAAQAKGGTAAVLEVYKDYLKSTSPEMKDEIAKTMSYLSRAGAHMTVARLSSDVKRYDEAVAEYDAAAKETGNDSAQLATIAYERLLAVKHLPIGGGLLTKDLEKRAEMLDAMLNLEKSHSTPFLTYEIAVLQYQLDRPDAARLAKLVDMVDMTKSEGNRERVPESGTILHIAAAGFHDLGMMDAYASVRQKLDAFDSAWGTNFVGHGDGRTMPNRLD